MAGIGTFQNNRCIDGDAGVIFEGEYDNLSVGCARASANVPFPDGTPDAMCLGLPGVSRPASAGNVMRVSFANKGAQRNVVSISCPGAVSVTGAGAGVGEVTLNDGGSCPLTVTGPAESGGTFGLSGTTLSRIGDAYFVTPGTISGGVYSGSAPGTAPSISVSGNGTIIADGDTTPTISDHTSFMDRTIGGGQFMDRTFTIINSGTGQLTVTAVNITGAAATDFSIVTPPAINIAPSGGTTTFTVRFDPSALGARNAVIEINSNDAAASPYSFALSGEGRPDPSLAMTVTPTTIGVGETSRLRIILSDISTLGFDIDALSTSLPAGLTVAAPNGLNTSGTCPAVTAAAGSNSISLASGTVTGVCTIDVDITGGAIGAHNITTGNFTGSFQGQAFSYSSAGAVLTVTDQVDISVTNTDGLTSAVTGSSLTYTIVVANSGPLDDPSVRLTDNFPAELIGCNYSSVATAGATGNTVLGSGNISETLAMSAGSSVTYTATCTIAPSASGTLSNTATVSSSLSDPVASNNSATDSDTVLTPGDFTSPTIEILNAPKTFAERTSFIATFQFSEPITGFEVNDILIGNGEVSNFAAQDTDTFLAKITPTGKGDVTIDVPAGAANDSSGNLSLAAAQVIVRNNTIEDTVRVIGSFIENRGRMILANQPDGQRRLARLKGRHTNNGGISGFGLSYQNGNIPFSALLGTQEMSFAYSLLNSRAQTSEARLDTDLIQLLRYAGLQMTQGPNPTQVQTLPPAAGNDNATQIEGITSPIPELPKSTSPAERALKPFDIWVEGVYSFYNTGEGKGEMAILHAGADYMLTPDLLLGLGTQFDWMDYSDSGKRSRAEGYGFMIGPYITARLSDGLYLEGRIAWGQSDNSVSPYGSYEDSFSTERALVTTTLTGEYSYQELTIQPELRLSWFWEQTQTYIDSLGNNIPEVAAESGVLEFGPTFARTFEVSDGLTVTPQVSLKGVWTFAQRNTAQKIVAVDATNQLTDEGWRAQIEAGLDISAGNGLMLGISGSHDGLGDSEFSSWGTKAHLELQW
jgi:uncharacterized repeat protein (TIGR01451 family)